MANMSLFKGWVCAHKRTSDISAEELNKVLDYTSKCFYGKLKTGIEPYNFGENYSITSTGRWTWVNSMDEILDEIRYEIRGDKSMSKEEQEDLIDRLTGLRIEYSGVDYEPGNGVLYQAFGSLTWNDPTLEHRCETYSMEITAENLETFGLAQTAGGTNTKRGMRNIYEGLIKDGQLTENVSFEEFAWFLESNSISIHPDELEYIIENFAESLYYRRGIDIPEGAEILDEVIKKDLETNKPIKKVVDPKQVEKIKKLVRELVANKSKISYGPDRFAVGPMVLNNVLSAEPTEINRSYVRYLRDFCFCDKQLQNILEDLSIALKNLYVYKS